MDDLLNFFKKKKDQCGANAASHLMSDFGLQPVSELFLQFPILRKIGSWTDEQCDFALEGLNLFFWKSGNRKPIFRISTPSEFEEVEGFVDALNGAVGAKSAALYGVLEWFSFWLARLSDSIDESKSMMDQPSFDPSITVPATMSTKHELMLISLVYEYDILVNSSPDLDFCMEHFNTFVTIPCLSDDLKFNSFRAMVAEFFSHNGVSVPQYFRRKAS